MIEFSEITLSHGDGGQITLDFIKNEILTRFGNPILNELEDGSRITLDKSKIIVSTDSYIVDPPIFPGGNIGKLAISGTVNDLVASGAIPHYLTLSIIVAEKFSLSILKEILDSAQETACSANIQIVAGDTKVVDKKSFSGIFLNTSGFGTPLISEKDYAVSNACPGDKVIVTGTVGDHGFAVISAREGLGFEQKIQSDCNPLNNLIIPILKNFDGVNCLRDPTRGGLIGAIIDIAESSATDILIDKNIVPVKKEVKFGCEMLGIDPMSIVNEGKMIIVVADKHADEVIAQLHQHPLGSDSTIIGEVLHKKSSIGRFILIDNDRERIIIRPRTQNLPRLC